MKRNISLRPLSFSSEAAGALYGRCIFRSLLWKVTQQVSFFLFFFAMLLSLFLLLLLLSFSFYYYYYFSLIWKSKFFFSFTLICIGCKYMSYGNFCIFSSYLCLKLKVLGNTVSLITWLLFSFRLGLVLLLGYLMSHCKSRSLTKGGYDRF